MSQSMVVFETKSLASNRDSTGLTVFVKVEINDATGGASKARMP